MSVKMKNETFTIVKKLNEETIKIADYFFKCILLVREHRDTGKGSKRRR
jgi:hypothetical protein